MANFGVAFARLRFSPYCRRLLRAYDGDCEADRRDSLRIFATRLRITPRTALALSTAAVPVHCQGSSGRYFRLRGADQRHSSKFAATNLFAMGARSVRG